MKRKILTVGGGIALALPAMLLAAPAAHASLACSGTRILINSNPGYEAPSYATGHTHTTGNHYVRVIYSDRTWEWWADGNGGFNGDEWDFYYGLIQC